MADDCLICRIVHKEEQVSLIYEDADTVAFPYSSPIAEGHTIVAPKKHFTNVFDAEPEALTATIMAVQTVSQRMKDTLGSGGVNLINNSGGVAGQEVFHFHMHIVPRREGDELGLVSFSGKTKER